MSNPNVKFTKATVRMLEQDLEDMSQNCGGVSCDDCPFMIIDIDGNGQSCVCSETGRMFLGYEDESPEYKEFLEKTAQAWLRYYNGEPMNSGVRHEENE